MKRLLPVAALLAGCGGSNAPAVVHRAPPPPLAKRCGAAPVPARTFWFTASDGTRLDGAELGSGARGVIMLHESPADLCGWVPYAETLRRRGFHVLLVDLRGYGLSRPGTLGPSGARADARGAVDELRRRGTKRVALVGASYGGATALVAAPALGSDISGVASLAGEISLGSGSMRLDALSAVRRLHVPLLVMASHGDRFISRVEARQIVRAAGSKQKRFVEFGGYAHGWDLLAFPPRTIVPTASSSDFCGA